MSLANGSTSQAGRYVDSVPLLNGIDIHIATSGPSDAPRTLLLNGSGATVERSRDLIAAFSSDFFVACHDQRGLGRTGIPTGPYSMGDYAADAVAVADYLGWETFRLAGISFGGMVAQEVAATVPTRIEKLALLCTSPGGAGGSSFPLHELVSMDLEQRASTYRTLLDTRFTDEWLQEHPGEHALLHAMATRSSVEKDPEALRGEWEQLQARRHHDVWDRLPLITCPTLVAAGRYDGIAPLDNSIAIASRIPHSELRIYEGGHAFVVQDPRALSEICAFLRA